MNHLLLMPDTPGARQQNRTIITATQEDQNSISRFLASNHLTHRHLDWFSPMEWIGQQPFLLEVTQNQIQSILLAAPEVPEAAWVRLFSTQDHLSIEASWLRLLSQTIATLRDMGVRILAALHTSDWFASLLSSSGFLHSNDIVVLTTKRQSALTPYAHPELTIRSMRVDDLLQVHKIDQSAFDPLWQNSLPSLTRAFQGQGLSTVAIKNGKIVGYQISTWLGAQSHLARLAVDPEHQGQRVASALVEDLLTRFHQMGIGHITVNTQADNLASLHVYHKFGFQPTGESIPVYLHDLDL